MAEVGGDVRGLMAQARRVAQKHSHPLTTGHVLCAMLNSREAGRLLGAYGLREVTLLQQLGQGGAEALNAIEVALARSGQLAEQSGAHKVHPLHLLLALIRDTRSTASQCLERLGTDTGALQQVLEDSLGTPSRARTASPSHERSEAEPQPSRAREARERAQGAPTPALPRTSIDWEAQRRAANAPDAATSSTVRAREGVEEPSERSDVSETPARKGQPRGTARRRATIAAAGRDASERNSSPHELDGRRFPMLSVLGRNLTALAAAGKLDPVIGRDAEVQAVLDIVARRRANNPILVGPPGVGKTAVAEGVALELVAQGADSALGDRVLIELSAGALISGTGVRGALAERLARLRNEVAASEGRVLLFLDEIHALVGGGDGPDDIANELKASLSRGELPCVGATTEAEYRRVFERDSALARRFSRVEVQEPSREDAVRIVRGIAARYARFHDVAYSDDALCSAVELSARYMPEQHLPDKAIGLIDLAAARARRRGATRVDRESIAAVVSDQTGVPLDRLTLRDGERLLKLESLLHKRVVGQDDALHRIAEALRKGAVGLRGKRPLGVFMLLGPTGVGKTELAKALSDELFPQTGMTRLDLSEFSESHAVARLFGAPPGYVGHDEGGQLTEAVRRRPYQLVLLDEAEKAHPDVLLSLLPLLDEGHLTDSRGRRVDFTNTVVVLTSNLGASAAACETRRIGFGAPRQTTPAQDPAAQRALAAVRAALPPELFNRMDEVLYCAALSRGEVREIARRMLDSVARLLELEQGLVLEIDESVCDALIEAGGYDPTLGARPMRRTVGRLVESPLATALLEGRLARGQRARLVGRGAEVHIVAQSGAAHAAQLG